MICANLEVSKYFLYVTRKNDDTFTFSLFRFSLVGSVTNYFSQICLSLSFFIGIYLRPCLYLSRNIGNHDVCVWSCIVLLSDYFYLPVFTTIVKLTIGATSNTSNCDRYMERCTEEKCECSFPHAYIFLNIQIALLVKFLYVDSEECHDNRSV